MCFIILELKFLFVKLIILLFMAFAFLFFVCFSFFFFFWLLHFLRFSVQFSSVPQSCSTLRDPMDCSTPGLPVHHQLPEFTQTHVRWLVMPSNYLILCHPLLLLPSIFPSIRVFSKESVLHIRWPKYWSFSFSISPSNEYSGLISFGRRQWHPTPVLLPEKSHGLRSLVGCSPWGR